jgi:DNA adenine methylase
MRKSNTLRDAPSQLLLLEDGAKQRSVAPFNTQLLKWVGNKQRFAHEIISYFPLQIGTYYEPFLGSGAVLATLVPEKAIASDVFKPLMEIWQTLKSAPETLKEWYTERWQQMARGDKASAYERIKASYNSHPNGADLLYISRACYGGVIRFRQSDGYISTPCGVHNPISPESFGKRVDEWHRRTQGATFISADYADVMAQAEAGDLIYCDPPYSHSQSILYGAQSFDLAKLFEVIEQCKSRGVYVVLSIDGTKCSGNKLCDIPIPPDLFEWEIMVNCGRSMLKRFQMNGQTLEGELVADRLLLTY